MTNSSRDRDRQLLRDAIARMVQRGVLTQVNGEYMYADDATDNATIIQNAFRAWVDFRRLQRDRESGWWL